MTRNEKSNLKTIMWRLLQSRKVVTYDDLQELAGASRSYAQEWMATLIKREVVRKLSKGRYQLINDTVPETPEAPAKKPVIKTMAKGQKDLGNKRPIIRAEYSLWAAIIELKKFKIDDLLKLNIANETTAKQYVALLSRAGILNKTKLKAAKRKQYGGRYLIQYFLVKNPGEMAPLMGRCFYLFDPNSGEYWATPMEGQKEDIINKRRNDIGKNYNKQITN